MQFPICNFQFAIANLPTVGERWAAFRADIEPELAAKRPPEWDDNLRSLNRERTPRPVRPCRPGDASRKNEPSPEKLPAAD